MEEVKKIKRIGAYKVLSDTTLKGETKADLIERIRILEHNWSATEESLDNSAKNSDKIFYEQKAEIERLTEEKKTLVWLNQDLKKQVDEQDKEIDRLGKVVHEQAEQYYNLEQKTAVEILQKGRYCMPSGLRDWIKERYGVEVE